MKSIVRLMKRIRARLHSHQWEDTRVNPYGTATEQRCRCGAYRHHKFADLCGRWPEPMWHDGRHPNTTDHSAQVGAKS